MVAPDYQEFANRRATGYPWQYRDLRLRMGRTCRNRPGVARLPRHRTGSKVELSAQRGQKGAFAVQITRWKRSL